jgi:hypothetical protein
VNLLPRPGTEILLISASQVARIMGVCYCLCIEPLSLVSPLIPLLKSFSLIEEKSKSNLRENRPSVKLFPHIFVEMVRCS